MSVFDPYSLYHRKYRKTHKGQVIQQKPTDYKTPILKEEIPRSLSVLKTFRYTIIPPDIPLSITSNLSWVTNRYINLGGETIHNDTYTTDNINLKNTYPFNEIPAESVTDFSITYAIESISFQNQWHM